MPAAHNGNTGEPARQSTKPAIIGTVGMHNIWTLLPEITVKQGKRARTHFHINGSAVERQTGKRPALFLQWAPGPTYQRNPVPSLQEHVGFLKHTNFLATPSGGGFGVKDVERLQGRNSDQTG
tara:strand:- start:676 stop:1044 length:369 start_codon:yes stop_codon:yes gene_type:complete